MPAMGEASQHCFMNVWFIYATHKSTISRLALAAAASLGEGSWSLPTLAASSGVLRAGGALGRFPASRAVAPLVSATPPPAPDPVAPVLVTPPFSPRGHAPESASLPPTSGTGWGHRQGGDSFCTWRPSPGNVLAVSRVSFFLQGHSAAEKWKVCGLCRQHKPHSAGSRRPCSLQKNSPLSLASSPFKTPAQSHFSERVKGS
ncbi:unnamed protein product [Rangifer tarandus platyrhynchus]|uniref:Uncharacterized protein n=1 Tax=Rangifer tarandus platyrhynchus TaxID=3082113 RepID=A0ABN8ZZG5_RANTA|nr:unnamed protein product [Rangifer tarandus platyrhynchus]